MTHAFSTQATAFCLAAAVTLGVLLGLDGLAAAEHPAAQPVAQATQSAGSAS